MTLLGKVLEVKQPEIYVPEFRELHVAIASLSLGGAERIVIDWAQRIIPQWRVHLIILRNRAQEWKVPNYVRITRLGGENINARLREVGAIIARDANPVCACHLLTAVERSMLVKAGVIVVPVFHNAKKGWQEGVDSLKDVSSVVAVSQSCANDLRDEGWEGAVSVIRHIPSVRKNPENIREMVRKAWNIPQNAVVIGMLGAIKPQKNYNLALEIFAQFLRRQDAYLVIVGGPVNTSVGNEAWKQVISRIDELGLRSRVAMPGFVPDAVRVLSAFDVVLNSSHFEGLSIATLEAIIAGVPVVASRVGGQGELTHDALALLPVDAPLAEWVDALIESIHKVVAMPVWADFPSHRLWTLASLARPIKPSPKTLFVTANLNAGGAQRSLVNLAKELRGQLDFEIMVTGRSTATYFLEELQKSGVKVMMAGGRWNVFDFAESIAAKIVSEGFGTLCFWNTDARAKLLLAKAFESGGLRFIDVSPGGHSFEEMDSTQEFQNMIAFTSNQYFKRLDRLILKYEAKPAVGCEGKMKVIRNGVPFEKNYKRNYDKRTASHRCIRKNCPYKVHY